MADKLRPTGEGRQQQMRLNLGPATAPQKMTEIEADHRQLEQARAALTQAEIGHLADTVRAQALQGQAARSPAASQARLQVDSDAQRLAGLEMSVHIARLQLRYLCGAQAGGSGADGQPANVLCSGVSTGGT